MARIREYTSKGSLSTNGEGVNAFETAARRVGPLAQQAAADIAKLGKDVAQTAENDSKFAYMFTDPYASLLDRKSGGGGGGGGIKFGKTERTLVGTGAGASRPDDRDVNSAGQAVKYNGPDIAAGAAKLTAAANKALGVPKGGVPGELGPDGVPVNEGGRETENTRGVDPRAQYGGGGATVLRGGGVRVSDIENGVTVMRGGTGASLIDVGPWTRGGPEANKIKLDAPGATYQGMPGFENKDFSPVPATGIDPNVQASYLKDPTYEKWLKKIGVTPAKFKDDGSVETPAKDYLGNDITGPGIPLRPEVKTPGWFGSTFGQETYAAPTYNAEPGRPPVPVQPNDLAPVAGNSDIAEPVEPVQDTPLAPRGGDRSSDVPLDPRNYN